LKCSNKKTKIRINILQKNRNTYQNITKNKINNSALKIKLKIDDKYDENELFFVNPQPPIYFLIGIYQKKMKKPKNDSSRCCDDVACG